MYKFRFWNVTTKEMIYPDSLIYPFELPKDDSIITMLCTDKHDVNDKMVYGGDIIEDENHLRMEVRFGTYCALCPVEKHLKDNVGFYVVAEMLQDMPIGNLEKYAQVIGNIYENPELKVNVGQHGEPFPDIPDTLEEGDKKFGNCHCTQ